MLSKSEIVEVIDIVEKLNDECMEKGGQTLFNVAVCYGIVVVRIFGHYTLWCNEDDDREFIGFCPESNCDHRCSSCGGTGKDEPREPLEGYLRKAALELAANINNALGENG